jgi:hypothetical protein
MSPTSLRSSFVYAKEVILDVTTTPLEFPSEPTNQGLSQKVIIVLAVTLSIVVSIAMILSVMYCYRVRSQRNVQKQHEADVENCLQRARPPMLALDTDIPRANEVQRSASALDLQLHRS